MHTINSWRVAFLGLLLIVIVGIIFGRMDYTAQVHATIEQAKIIKELRGKEETLDLALEFGFDPMIVTVTRQLATDAIRQHWCQCPTWRFVRTEKDLTYILLSIVQTESRGNYKAINVPNGPSSGIGLTQLLLSTARQYDKSVDQSELLTIPRHLHIAMEYFVDLLQKYNGNYTLAVLAWNRGPSTVDRLISFGQTPENGYARAIFTQAAIRNARQ